MTDILTFRSRGALVGGRWVGDGPRDAFESRCPFDTRHVVGRFGTHLDRLDDAVEEAHRAQRAWRCWSLDRRLDVLREFATKLDGRSDSLAALVTAEVGKPIAESRAEVGILSSKIGVTVDVAPEELASRRTPEVGGYYDMRPLGVFAVVGPFNFPMHLSNGHIAPALVAGNAVVLKPSDVAPACAEAYAGAWLDAAAATGAPAGLFGLLQGGGNVGAALVEHAGVDAVAFTGSYGVGVAIRRATAHQTGKLLALEMGGKNAAVVLGDADVARAAADIASAALSTTGQRCTATSRVIADDRIADELSDRIAEHFRAVRVGDPRDESFDMGPLATSAARDRFVAAQSQLAGLRTVVAGGAASASTPGWWVRPAMHEVVDAGIAAPRIGEELFGPEVLVERVAGDEEAIARANATEFGLATSVHTTERARFEAVRAELNAGLINWNRGTAGASSRLPFGGTGRSGNLRPAGSAAIRYCARPVATLEGD